MTGSWVSVLTTLIPLALVVSISPLSVIPAVLVLQTPRPRPTGLAFLGGWLLGLVAAMEQTARPEVRKAPCDARMISAAAAHLARPAGSFAQYGSAFSLRN